MTKSMRTPLFSMKTLPVYPGVYEHLSAHDRLFYFSRWDGRQWHANSLYKSTAAESTIRSNAAYSPRILGWRGLVEKPE